MSQQSFLQTTATGSDINFTITTFSSDEILVYVDGVKKTAGVHYNINPYNSNGQSTVDWIGTAPSSPSVVRVVRQTDVLNNGDTAVEGRATYQAGASVKADDLNNNQTQVLRSLQEHNDQLIQTYDIEPDAITNAKIADNAIDSEQYVDGSIDRVHLAADIVDGTKIADNSIDSEHYVDGSIDVEHLADNSVDRASIVNDAVNGDKIADDSINSEHYVDGSIDEQHLSNSAISSTKIADNAITTTEILNGAVTRAKLEADIIDGTKLADNAVNSEHYVDGSISTAHIGNSQVTGVKIASNSIDSGKIVDGSISRPKIVADAVDGTKIADDAVGSEHIQANAVTDSEIATGTLDNRYFTETELTNGALDGRYFTETESDARYFNISSGETIKDGDTFPDNDTTIATTAAINDRIIDLIDDVGGFDIIQSEQHFPNTNPQGTTGQAAVLSIKAASTNLVPSGTTVTISNGNLANNADITITGVTSTIPTGFGFLVESTSTTHTYGFHRLVPKATEVTTVAGNITNINAAANNASNINAAVANASNINAAVSNASNITTVAGNNSNITSVANNASNINAAVANASNINTTASSITNVNNVGNNITNVNSVSNSAGANQTFTVTVQNVSGNKYFIDGVQTPVLKLARGKTYTFDMSDSSNSSHPLAFRDSSDNAYTTGVTTSGTAGSSGATVVIVVAANAPSSLKYYCTSHGNSMGNTINVIDDNVGTVAGSISNVNTVGGAISNVNTTAGSIGNVNTVASNISSVNSFFNTYRIGSNNPTTSLDVGDLFFNTTSNSLKVYTGSAWVDGVTQTGNFALTTGNTFTGSNNHNDNVQSIYGTDNDLAVYYNSSSDRSIIASNGARLDLRSDAVHITSYDVGETMATFTDNGAAELYYDNSKKLETTSDAVKISGKLLPSANATHKFGSSSLRWTQGYFSYAVYLPDEANGGFIAGNDFDVKLYHSGSNSHLDHNGAGNLRIRTTGTDENITLEPTGNVQIPVDTKKLQIGAGQDLWLYHTGTDSIIQNFTNELKIASNHLKLKNRDTDETYISCVDNGATELFYDNSKKLETTSSGVTVVGDASTGTIIQGAFSLRDTSSSSDRIKWHPNNPYALRWSDNFKATFGSSDDLQIYHDGSHSFIRDTGTGALQLSGNRITMRNGDAASEYMFTADENGAVELYYDNSKKLETTSSGTTISGNLLANTASGRSTELHSSGIGITRDSKTLDLNANYAGANTHAQINSNQTQLRLGINNSDTLRVTADSIILADDKKAIFGNSNDLQIYHSGSHSYIKDAGTGYLLTLASGFAVQNAAGSETIMSMVENGSVDLYYDDSKKFETTSSGNKITGQLEITGGSDEQIMLKGTTPFIRWYESGTQKAYAQWNSNGYLELYNHETSKGLRIGGSGVEITDTIKFTAGDAQDLQVYHDSVNSYINNSTGILHLRGDTIALHAMSNTEKYLDATANGAVKLYYNGEKTIETFTNATHFFGNQHECNLDFKASNGHRIGFFGITAGGRVQINGADGGGGNYETYLEGNLNGETELYYDNSVKLVTDNGGTRINGNLYIDGVVNANIRMQSGPSTVYAGIDFYNNAGSAANSINSYAASILFITGRSATVFSDVSGEICEIVSGGIHPRTSSTVADLGTSSKRWRNIYTNDLHLSNKGGSNDVDSTWGDWTIQEGESDLFLKNNRSGKKFKFNLTEVS